MWQPLHTINLAIVQALIRIEGARVEVAATSLSLEIEEELRQRARIRSTPFSTRIEGNRLTLARTEQVVTGEGVYANFVRR